MDARDRLRRYLEQRRELGESEYVLDGMSVESVLDLVGAKSMAPAPRTNADGGSVRSSGARSSAERSSAERSSAERSSAMRRAEPTPPQDDQPPAERPPATEAGAPPLAAAEFAPPLPELRYDEGSSADWRTALRGLNPAAPRTPDSGNERPTAPEAPSAGANDSAPAKRAPSPASSAAERVAQLPAWLEALGIPAGIEAGASQATSVAPDIAELPTLDQLVQHVAGCQRCALHASAKHPVPGEGNPEADLLCVGEAPGANEDDLGRPFVGDAGQLLTRILGAIQLSRESVYICNVLKHRPPGNRDPLPDEVHACQPYLLRQIELVRPRVILALGRFAAQTLLQTTSSISVLRGRLHRFHGVPLIVTYHPAALLRNESWKRPTWEDVKLARRVLDAAAAAGGRTDSPPTGSR